jgi:NAD(P)-dependent dehydrogenase (short-subunit alcohol dehydrogenase family)
MQEFKEKVAVITGAASGIGRSIAARCVQEGMKVVLADIEAQALTHVAKELQAAGASVRAVVTDVSKAGDVEALAQKTLETFGAVHLLCNNAGVLVVSPLWESTVADWEWVLGVNLWGVIHGVRVFVPLMLAQDTEAHIVNTASTAGLVTGSGLGIYRVTKHGVVALSEVLYHELAQQGAKIKVSVLCPHWVNTQIMEAARNRPAAIQNASREDSSTLKRQRETLRQSTQAGTSPEGIAEQVFQAVKEERFYILPHPELKQRIQTRMEDILQERNPAMRS